MAGRRRTSSKKDKVAGRMPSHRGTVYADGVTTQIDRTGKISAIATVPPSGNGSVTSVALTAAPTSVFNVSGSPITTAGTLALSMDDQAKNKVMAGPTTGADATPSFRSLVVADLPDISTDRLWGRDTSGTGAEEEISLGTNLEFTGSQSIRHTASALAANTYYYPKSITTDAQGHATAFVSDQFLNGEGLVYGEARPSRTLASLSAILCVPELNNAVYFCTVAVNGLLCLLDPITKEHYTLATHSSKTLINMVYSPHASSLKLYINYGTNTMSVNPATGAAVTTGMAKDMRAGMCVHPTSGILYGYDGTTLNRIDTTTDTTAANIVLTGTGNNSMKKTVTYCPTNDSVYVYVNATHISRVSCASNTEAASFSCAGMSGGTNAGSIAYNAWSNKIFAYSGTSATLVQIDPTTDAQQTSYAFPPGTGGVAASACGIVSAGRYLYVGTTGTTPTEVLIFDCQTLAFIGCLNTLTGTGGQTSGAIMAVLQAAAGDDSLLFTSQTGAWCYFGGRS
jgi:hypothetical protein